MGSNASFLRPSGFNEIKNFTWMISRLGHLGPMFFNLALGIDPNRGSNHTHYQLAVHLFLTKGAIFAHYLFLRVT